MLLSFKQLIKGVNSVLPLKRIVTAVCVLEMIMLL